MANPLGQYFKEQPISFTAWNSGFSMPWTCVPAEFNCSIFNHWGFFPIIFPACPLTLLYFIISIPILPPSRQQQNDMRKHGETVWNNSVAWKYNYYISTKSKRGSFSQIKFVLNNSSVLSHLIESSTSFRDASNVESMPKGHCHCTTSEIKPGLKIIIRMKWTFWHLPISSTSMAKSPKKPQNKKANWFMGFCSLRKAGLLAWTDWAGTKWA